MGRYKSPSDPLNGHEKLKLDLFLWVKQVVNISYPREWMKIYFKNNYQAVDPILKAHFSTFKAQRWRDTYKINPDTDKKFLETSRDFDLFDGLTHGVYEPNPSTGTIFSFSGSSAKPSDQQITRLQLIIPHLHQAFVRFCREESLPPIF